MMPISHYVGLILSHGVQMCSFFSIICCKRLENASRYTTRLKQLTLVMNIGYLDFDGPSEQSQSVSRAKTHMTLKCTFWSKIGLFGGFGKYSGKALLTFFFHWQSQSSLVGYQSRTVWTFELCGTKISRWNVHCHIDLFQRSSATRTTKSVVCNTLALGSRKLVLHTEKSEK